MDIIAEVTIFVDVTGEGLQQFEQFLTQMDGIERVSLLIPMMAK